MDAVSAARSHSKTVTDSRRKSFKGKRIGTSQTWWADWVVLHQNPASGIVGIDVKAVVFEQPAGGLIAIGANQDADQPLGSSAFCDVAQCGLQQDVFKSQAQHAAA